MKARHMLAAATMVATSLAAQAQSCPASNIDVKVKYTAPWSDFMPLAQLNADQPANGPTRLGITSSTLDSSIEYSRATTQGGQCSHVQGTLHLLMAQHDVRIASEIRSMPCLLKEVSEHENQHVELNKVMLSDMQNLMAARIRTIIEASNKLAPSRRADLIETWAHQNMEQEIKAYWGEQNKRQMALDTPQEYARVAKRCPSEIQQLSQRLKRPS